MKARYRQAMEWLYIACIGLAGVVMLVMTIIMNVIARLLVWRVAGPVAGE